MCAEAPQYPTKVSPEVLTLLDFLAAVRAGREGVVMIGTLGVVMQGERALFEVSRVGIGLILGVFLGGVM